jgi:hypothetical protein
MQKGTLF